MLDPHLNHGRNEISFANKFCTPSDSSRIFYTSRSKPLNVLERSLIPLLLIKKKVTFNRVLIKFQSMKFLYHIKCFIH